jgi:signal transduction histidine kinase
MSVRDWFRPPRSVLTLYAIGAATGVGCLIWLAASLLAQEKVVEAERARAELDAAADRAVALSQRSLNELERLLSVDQAQPPPGTVVIRVDRSKIDVRPVGGLMFVPAGSSASSSSFSEVPGDPFRSGESAEFGAGGLTRAIDLYRVLAQHPSAVVRAGALIRLGRTLRKARRPAEALQAYSDLARLDGAAIRVEGRSMDLFAREARCSTLEETGDRTRLEREADELRRDLAHGRWPLAPSLWEYLFTETSVWAGPSARAIAGLDDALAVARATDAFWRQWRDAPPAAQLVMRDEGRPVLILWKGVPPGMHAVVAGPARVEAIWKQIAIEADAQVALADRDGRPILGRLSGPQANRSAADTGLPWSVAVASAHPDRAVAEAGAHRRLLLAGLAIVGLLIGGSTYFTFRGIRRELATARLQSDFVSAVSHEFRTPLTSIRQLSHMLRDKRVGDDDRRGQYYDVLVRESERLYRLVERLLSFGRAEAERYRFESVDACDLARTVVADFQRSAGEWRLEVTTAPAPCSVRADREMLSLVLWNLLDNAMKYSPERRTIWIDVSSNGSRVATAVRDEGVGISQPDRRRIFQKFVRGGADQTSSVQGSGLGLALVERVVHAHGGEVLLDSNVGQGSTFTIVIPAETMA